MPNLTPSEQARLDILDAAIAANKLRMDPIKKERKQILANARHRAWRERNKGR